MQDIIDRIHVRIAELRTVELTGDTLAALLQLVEVALGRINLWQQVAERSLAFPFWEKIREQTADFDEGQKQRFYQTLIVYLAAAAGLAPEKLAEVLADAREVTIKLVSDEILTNSFLDERQAEPSASSPTSEPQPVPEPPPKHNEPKIAGGDAQPTNQGVSDRLSTSITKPLLLAGNCESFHKEMEEFVERIQNVFNIAPNSPDDIRTLQKDQAARGYVKAQLTPTPSGWSVRDSSELSGRAFIVRDCKTRTEAIEAGKQWVAEAPDRRELIAWPCDMRLPEEAPYGNPELLMDLYRREWELSRVDPLTGALNRRAFMEVLSEASKHSRRHSRPLTLACVDLDGFKRINDVLGHSTGDSVLKVVARTMQCTLREVDSVARLGGDEFAVLLPETGGENVCLVLERLHNALTEAMAASKWAVTFSIGAVTFRRPLASAADMISEADKVMYSAKAGGKNRVHVAFGFQ
jgi:diguanylate cyclase (GGDEF)-like protein